MTNLRYDIIIVGAGFAGIGMAISLLKNGITNFAILEKEDEIGGTWYVNTYPGCACDVESHLYSYSFEPKTDWTKTFPDQKEILEYLKHCVEKYNLREKIQTNTIVTEALYEETNAEWQIRTNTDALFSSKIFIPGTGGLSKAAYPDIKGMHTFQGVSFHTQKWNHDYSLKGKDVVIVGTGASAIQIVPEIVREVKQLYIIQRTPPWILPKKDKNFSNFKKNIFRKVPFFRYLYRERLYWLHEIVAFGFVKKPIILKWASFISKRFIKKSVKDLDLQKKLIPDYTMGCKRILLSNDYYKSLNAENVKLIAEPVTEINETSVITDSGKNIKADAIIYASGFNVTEYLSDIKIRGKAGLLLSDLWQGSGTAYLGTAVHGFPNMFMLTGPNTGLGHNSIIHIIESQVNYILQGVKKILSKQYAALEIKEEVQNNYNQKLQKKMKKTVWQTGGCISWYQDDRGNNPTLWPGYTVTFRKKTAKFKEDEWLKEKI